MSTAGAIHCAESARWSAAQQEPESEPIPQPVMQFEPEPPIQPATAPLVDFAVDHDSRAPWWYVRHHLRQERVA
jgi:hypothetical protein